VMVQNPFNGIERRCPGCGLEPREFGNPFNGIESTLIYVIQFIPLLTLCESIQWNWKVTKLPYDGVTPVTAMPVNPFNGIESDPPVHQPVAKDIPHRESIQWNWKSAEYAVMRRASSITMENPFNGIER